MQTTTKLKTIKKAGLLSSSCFLIPGILLMLYAGFSAHSQPVAAGDPYVLIASEGPHFINPVWSPDGKHIAFSSDNYNGIWLADAQGQNVRKLTDDQAAGFGFSWSPDGQFILARPAVFENRRRFHQVKVYDVNLLEEEILLDKSRDLQGLPAWTHDGAKVAMVLNGKPELKTSDKFSINTSQKNSHAVYAMDGKLYNHNHITKSDAEITAFEGRTIFNIVPSPEGDKVAFQVQGSGLYVLNTDGSGLKHLGYGERASWLPDGEHIVVSVVEDDGHNVTGAELYVIHTGNEQSYHITAHTSLVALKPSVSPCGKFVAFDNPEDGNIYVMPLR